MSENPVIYVLVGIPGSGKSTARAAMVAHTASSVVVSSDDYIENFAKSVNKTYNEVFADAVKYTNEHMDRLVKYAIDNNLSIIWDQTNLTAKKRKQILSKVPDSYRKIAVFVDTPVNVALERNSKRSRTIPENIIKSMYMTLEPPTEDEGFDEVLSRW